MAALEAEVSSSLSSPPSSSSSSHSSIPLQEGETITKTTVIQRLWAGYGQLYRVSIKAKDGNTRSVVVKKINIPSSVESSVGNLRKIKSYQVEETFYEKYAPKLELNRVPKLLGRGRNVGEMIILEDLDTEYNLRRYRVKEMEAQWCLQWLARLHRTFLGVPQTTDLWSTGCYWHLATRPDELATMEKGELKEYAAILDEQLERARYKTLVHGDAKLANFCFSSRGVAAVDFQYCGTGVGVRDVAYFLHSAYDEGELEERSPNMLDYYFRELQCGADVEKEWRFLYPIVVADFERFYRGWSPGGHRERMFSQKMVDEALKRFR